MRTGCQPALWKHGRGVDYILLRREQDVLRGFLAAFCQLIISKSGEMIGQTAPIVVVFVRPAKRFKGKSPELR